MGMRNRTIVMMVFMADSWREWSMETGTADGYSRGNSGRRNH